MSRIQISASTTSGELHSRSSRASGIVLAVVLSLAFAGCHSNPAGPSTLSTASESADDSASSGQPPVTLLPPPSPAPPPVMPGQPAVTLPAPSPLPMPDVTPAQPGTTQEGEFSVPK
jgi:hypothetical protein